MASNGASNVPASASAGATAGAPAAAAAAAAPSQPTAQTSTKTTNAHDVPAPAPANTNPKATDTVLPPGITHPAAPNAAIGAGNSNNNNGSLPPPPAVPVVPSLPPPQQQQLGVQPLPAPVPPPTLPIQQHQQPSPAGPNPIDFIAQLMALQAEQTSKELQKKEQELAALRAQLNAPKQNKDDERNTTPPAGSSVPNNVTAPAAAPTVPVPVPQPAPTSFPILQMNSEAMASLLKAFQQQHQPVPVPAPAPVPTPTPTMDSGNMMATVMAAVTAAMAGQQRDRERAEDRREQERLERQKADMERLGRKKDDDDGRMTVVKDFYFAASKTPMTEAEEKNIRETFTTMAAVKLARENKWAALGLKVPEDRSHQSKASEAASREEDEAKKQASNRSAFAPEDDASQSAEPAAKRRRLTEASDSKTDPFKAKKNAEVTFWLDQDAKTGMPILGVNPHFTEEQGMMMVPVPEQHRGSGKHNRPYLKLSHQLCSMMSAMKQKMASDNGFVDRYMPGAKKMGSLLPTVGSNSAVEQMLRELDEQHREA